MDHSNKPACPLYWNTGTVIVRLKMEVSSSCCKREVCPGSSCPEVVHRPSECEQCTRTRLISPCSVCDSSVVEKRPYRSSAARSRYVNVCAAVCLLLLVGGLSPRSSAAPHRSRASMERQRRATDEENVLWANPCDYDSQAVQSFSPTHVAKIAERLVKATQFAMNKASEYKDNITKVHGFKTFEALLAEWEGDDWLRKINPEALPKEKVIYQQLPDNIIETVMININDKLPTMYKDLKTIVAGLHNFSANGLNGNVAADTALKSRINQTMNDVRGVLCYFNQIMHARNLEILPLLDKDIPETNDPSFGLLLYRDTINYLEYLKQVFGKLAEMESKV